MDRFQDLDPRYVVLIALCLGVVLMLEAVRQTFVASLTANRQRTKRLRLLAKGLDREELLAKFRQSKPSVWIRIPFFGNIPQKMRQAGMTIKPTILIMLCLLIAGGVFLAAMKFIGPLLALAASVGLAVILPMAIVNVMRKRRIDKFAQQLPDALDLMKRGLKVGHPLNVTIANVARTMPDPIGTEFGVIADQVTYGESLQDAMMDLAQRIDQEDFYYLAVSIDIQHGSGGNLGNMLGSLANGDPSPLRHAPPDQGDFFGRADFRPDPKHPAGGDVSGNQFHGPRLLQFRLR